jgi:hypothetical protein
VQLLLLLYRASLVVLLLLLLLLLRRLRWLLLLMLVLLLLRVLLPLPALRLRATHCRTAAWSSCHPNTRIGRGRRLSYARR